MPFQNPLGLYALLALIPFIILYLRRPKPKEKTIPSLMFFMKDKGVTKFSNLFKQILRNLLFLIQLAILVSAAFATAAPFFMNESAARAKQTVLVIDGSASMQAELADGGTRFEKAISEAASRIEGDAGIILATTIPVIIMDRGSGSQAKKALSMLASKSTDTHIGDAMLAAGELVENPKKSRVVVLSDFQSNQGTDVLVAKRSLTARGVSVELVNVLKGKESVSGLSNVGFIQVDVNKFQTTALVRNYDDVQKSVDVVITNNNKKVGQQHLSIGQRSLEPVVFDTMHGKTQLEILQEDDLQVDNKAYISSPSKKVRALLITNSGNSNIMSALKSSPNVELTVAVPPIVKDFGFDVIILQNASTRLMLPGFYKEINKRVANGTGLVITAQDGLESHVKQLNMPVELSGFGNASKASVKVENRLTKGIDFGVVAKYYKVKPKKSDFTTLVQADDETPLLATYPVENGLVLYYGLFDDSSTFKSSYHYPIAWDNILSFLTKSDDISSFNLQTGVIQGISNQQVETPSGRIKTSRLYLDESGFYSYGSREVAVNLANKDESNIKSGDSFEVESQDSTMAVASEKAKGEVELREKLIFSGLALLFIELLIIKLRGDL